MERVTQAIWPFHKQECLRNEFADAVEESEPKFAAWMRKHGKQATLKDDEIDRQDLRHITLYETDNFTHGISPIKGQVVLLGQDILLWRFLCKRDVFSRDHVAFL